MDTFSPLPLMSIPNRVLAILAHPDDEVLSCFGTLARLAKAGSQVTICFCNDGRQGRLPQSEAGAALIGATVITLPDPWFHQEVEETRPFITLVDACIRQVQPDLIITHPELETDHHHHVLLSRIVRNAAYRLNIGAHLWLAEPITRSNTFRPRIFVNITDFLDVKMRAAKMQHDFLPRWYLEEDVIRIKAQRWLLLSPAHDLSTNAFEGFQVEYSVL